MKDVKYAVLGAGNGGQCIAAYLKLMGYEVSLYDRYEDVVKPLKEKGGIELKGASLNGFAEIENISTSIKQAVEGMDVILVVLPAFAHEYIAENLASELVDGQTVILCPGSTGGVLEFKRVLKEKNCIADIKLAETNSLFYAARLEKPGVAVIGGIKKVMPIAALPTSDTDEIIELLKEPYPQLVKEQNVLSSDMSNNNAIIHPYPVMLNTGWVEETKGGFKFYYDGISRTIGRMVEALDAERIEICKALGIKVKDIKESMYEYYSASGDTMYEIVRNVKGYAIVNAPPKLDTRLLTEDIPMGLVPMTEIAKLVNVKTPIMDLAIDLASALLERDFRAEGRTLERMGISGMNKEDLLEYVR